MRNVRTGLDPPHATVVDEDGSAEAGNVDGDGYSERKLDLIECRIFLAFGLRPEKGCVVGEDIGLEDTDASNSGFIAANRDGD